MYHEGKAVCSCPQLTQEKTCKIYKERFQEGQAYSFTRLVQIGTRAHVVNVHCGLIREIIKSGQLDKAIENQCCFAHEELLKEYSDDGKKLTHEASKRRQIGSGSKGAASQGKGKIRRTKRVSEARS